MTIRKYRRAITADEVLTRAKEFVSECNLYHYKETTVHEKQFVRSVQDFRKFSPKQLKWLRAIAARIGYDIPEEREAEFWDE